VSNGFWALAVASIQIYLGRGTNEVWRSRRPQTRRGASRGWVWAREGAVPSVGPGGRRPYFL